jgi:DNA-binding MarR family transcriptional regulator
MPAARAQPKVTDADYRALARFRRALRSFLHFSEEAAREAGVTPAQYQLMIIVRGAPSGEPPTIGDIAESLVLRHHSAVELVDRAETQGLVARVPDPDDGRRQRVVVTGAGEKVLAGLAAVHKAELRRLRKEGLSHLKDL